MSNPSTNPLGIRREVTRLFDELPIFKRPRSTALYNYCAVLEVEASITVPDPTAIFSTGREAAEASIQAIPAILTKCPAASDGEPRVKQAVYEEAYDLFRFSHAYEQVMYCFELADRAQFDVQHHPQSRRVVFSYASSEESNADTLIRSREIVATWDNKASDSDRQIIMSVAVDAKTELERSILFVGTDSITFEFSPALLLIAKRWATAVENAWRWEIPENQAVGSVCFGEIRKFWGAVATISNIHEMAHMVAGQGNARSHAWPIGSIVNLKARAEWAEWIAGVAGISVSKATSLLEWYTFDIKVAEQTPSIQPFLEVVPGRLCIPWSILVTNSLERNFLKLINRHPKLRAFAGDIKRIKETIALEHLSGLFPLPRFATEKTVVIEGVTDADMVVYERTSGFVLVIQHKWLIAPDTLKESSSNDEELSTGLLQAVASRDAFRPDHDRLRIVLHLSDADPISQIEAVVICRGAESTGFLGQPSVPIVLERAFESLWSNATSFGDLWSLLNSRPDHVEAAGQFHDTSSTIELAGYEFVLPVLVAEVSL